MKNETKTKIQLLQELKQTQEALQKNQIHFAGILEVANEAIISVNQAQRITLFNKGAEAIFGYTYAEVIDQPLDILLPTRFVANHHKHMVNFTKTVRIKRRDVREGIIGRRKNGQEFPAEASISKLNINDHIIFTVVLRDITERKQSEEEQARLIEELDAFAHTVGHELKAPLTMILAYGELLQGEARLPDTLQDYLTAIMRNGDRMNNVIDELQILSGVRNVDVSLQPLHMGRIVANAQQRLAHLIKEYQAQITVPENWPTVLGHAPWVEEVWANYLSNAIKYGGRPPRVQVGATIISNNTVRFWIRDNGPGLTPDAQAHLFTPFVQLNQVSIEGYGLGLSIVQRIVEKLGGQAGMESDGIPGQGCTFMFTLPQIDQEDKYEFF